MSRHPAARFGRAIHVGLRILGVAAVAVLVIATGLGAIGRYFHVGGVTWSFELVAMMFLWITAIGTVISELDGENVSIDGMNGDRGPVKHVLHAVVLLVVAGVMVHSGWSMLERTAFTPTPVMRAPSWTMQAIILVMGVGLGLIALLRLARLLR